MKSQDIQKYIDRVVGKDGTLRIPAWWMRKILTDILAYCGDSDNNEKIENLRTEILNSINRIESSTTNIQKIVKDLESNHIIKTIIINPTEYNKNECLSEIDKWINSEDKRFVKFKSPNTGKWYYSNSEVEPRMGLDLYGEPYVIVSNEQISHNVPYSRVYFFGSEDKDENPWGFFLRDEIVESHNLEFSGFNTSYDIDTNKITVSPKQIIQFSQTLPINPEFGIIYLVPNINGSEENKLIEYVYIDGNWEKFGEMSISADFSEYVKIADLEKNYLKKGDQACYANIQSSENFVEWCEPWTGNIKYVNFEFTNVNPSDKLIIESGSDINNRSEILNTSVETFVSWAYGFNNGVDYVSKELFNNGILKLQYYALNNRFVKISIQSIKKLNELCLPDSVLTDDDLLEIDKKIAIQPDYSISDETSVSFIKNKTHFMMDGDLANTTNGSIGDVVFSGLTTPIKVVGSGTAGTKYYFPWIDSTAILPIVSGGLYSIAVRFEYNELTNSYDMIKTNDYDSGGTGQFTIVNITTLPDYYLSDNIVRKKDLNWNELTNKPFSKEHLKDSSFDVYMDSSGEDFIFPDFIPDGDCIEVYLDDLYVETFWKNEPKEVSLNDVFDGTSLLTLVYTGSNFYISHNMFDSDSEFTLVFKQWGIKKIDDMFLPTSIVALQNRVEELENIISQITEKI